MMDARRYRHVIRLLGILLLGAFLLGTTPCTFEHAGDHDEAETTCICVCCEGTLSLDEPAVTPVAIHPVTADAVPHGPSIDTPRELLASIFQPPKA
jgi:hypothetical protein